MCVCFPVYKSVCVRLCMRGVGRCMCVCVGLFHILPPFCIRGTKLPLHYSYSVIMVIAFMIILEKNSVSVFRTLNDA